MLLSRRTALLCLAGVVLASAVRLFPLGDAVALLVPAARRDVVSDAINYRLLHPRAGVAAGG